MLTPETLMVLEILAIYALLQCANFIAWLMRRRHDVFHYVKDVDDATGEMGAEQVGAYSGFPR
jgi:hypothetical protein